MNSYQIIAFHQHVPAPLADTDHKEVDLEIVRCLPLAKDFEDSLLGILVLHGRSLRALEPADHVFHGDPSEGGKSRSAGRPNDLAVQLQAECSQLPNFTFR